MNVIEFEDYKFHSSIYLGNRIEYFADKIWYIPEYDNEKTCNHYMYSREDYLNGIMEWA
jgi:hypothetical protein